ncbi:leukocyte immunoglobulin-like receptor subfamily A member 6 [Equus asinus]|uniref:leukocyte immunoglobulin-like receptor subfamily A member 6 n=1 Tax=Equus asinus TaxID=9793 RepID=UPI0038F6F100
MTCHTERGPCPPSPSVCPAGLCGLSQLSAPLGTMGGRASTPVLTVLLCLGLCWSLWNQVQAGTPPKPSIWAEPGPVVTKGSPVTIWCQGSLRAEVYHLYKERVSIPVETETPQDSSNKTSFSIESMSSHTAGLYQCAYNTSMNSSSERSDPLPLVVTGAYSVPSLSAHPGPVVASGGNVSLWCSSEVTSSTFHLLKEGGANSPQQMELRIHNGVYREPSLSAQPGSLVLSGDDLTLQCLSEAGVDRFALTRDEGLTPLQHLHGQHSPDFPLGHVDHTHGGQYRCYGGYNLSHVWSAPSAPLDILIAGMYKKPSLTAQPGPSVSRGENVTLQCRSEIWSDTFHLSKEGSPAPPQLLRLQDTAAPFQANFTIGPLTSDHEGTYRCYGSHSTSPHLLSLPSDPLELRVSASHSKDYTVENLIRMGVACMILLILGILLFEAWHNPTRS